MGKFIDITGQKFGKLTAIRRVGTEPWGESIWLCHCNCGCYCHANTTDLREGKCLSCGGYKKTQNY